jgi:hypothetical protein
MADNKERAPQAFVEDNLATSTWTRATKILELLQLQHSGDTTAATVIATVAATTTSRAATSETASAYMSAVTAIARIAAASAPRRLTTILVTCATS